MRLDRIVQPRHVVLRWILHKLAADAQAEQESCECIVYQSSESFDPSTKRDAPNATIGFVVSSYSCISEWGVLGTPPGGLGDSCMLGPLILDCKIREPIRHIDTRLSHGLKVKRAHD